MHIELKKGIYLCSDQYQYWIQKEWITHKKDKDGNPQDILNTKKLSGFCTDLTSLYDSYFDRAVRESDAETVEELIRHIEKTRRDIRKWLKELRGNE